MSLLDIPKTIDVLSYTNDNELKKYVVLDFDKLKINNFEDIFDVKRFQSEVTFESQGEFVQFDSKHSPMLESIIAFDCIRNVSSEAIVTDKGLNIGIYTLFDMDIYRPFDIDFVKYPEFEKIDSLENEYSVVKKSQSDMDGQILKIDLNELWNEKVVGIVENTIGDKSDYEQNKDIAEKINEILESFSKKCQFSKIIDFSFDSTSSNDLPLSFVLAIQFASYGMCQELWFGDRGRNISYRVF